MAEDVGYVAPVDHGVLSSAGSVTTGFLGGAAKAFGKTMMWVVGGAALIGFLWGGGFFAAAGSLLAGSTAASSGVLATALSNISVGWGLVSGIAGGLFVGAPIGAVTSAFTGAYGAGKGALDAKNRVSMEKGQARAMEMQLEAYRSMAAANDNKYNLPAQGTRMNPAMAQIDAASADRSGTLVGQQLARA